MKKTRIHSLIELIYNPRTGGYDVLRDEWVWWSGPLALAANDPVLEWTNWAFYDDGTESGSVIIGSVNTDPTLDVDTSVPYLFRAGVHETAGNKYTNLNCQFEYNHEGGGWNTVTTTSSVVQVLTSANLIDQDDTTQRITSFDYINVNYGVDNSDGIAGTIADPRNDGFECLWPFQIIGADVDDGDSIELRVKINAGALIPGNQTNPTITVNKPAAATNRVIGSAVDVADVQTRVLAAVRALLASIDVSDSLVRTIEGAGLTLERTLASEVALTDALVQGVLADRRLADDAELYDQLVRTVLTQRTIADALAAPVDSLTREQRLARLALSAVAVVDSVGLAAQFVRALFDQVDPVADALESLVATIFAQTLRSEVAVADALALTFLLSRAVGSSADAADALLRSASFDRRLTEDALEVYDAVNLLVGAAPSLVERFLADNAAVNDAATARLILTRLLASTVAAVDALARDALLVRLLGDNPSVLDALVRALAEPLALRTLGDSIVVSDALVREIVLGEQFVQLILARLQVRAIDVDLVPQPIDADLSGVYDSVEVEDIVMAVENEGGLGLEWTPQTSNTTKHLYSVHGFDDDDLRNVVGGDNDAVTVRTTDGGVTWSPSAYALAEAFEHVHCRSNGTCIAVGWDLTTTGVGARSTTSGQTWVPVTMNSPDDLYGLVYDPVNDAWVASSLNLSAANPYLVRSTDDGQTWVPAANPFTNDIVALATDDAGRIFAGGEGGQNGYSDDGGATWTKNAANVANAVKDVAYDAVSGNVIMVGDAGKIYVSIDRGLTYQEKTNPVSALVTLNGVYANAIGVVIAVGRNEDILRSVDGGETWAVIREIALGTQWYDVFHGGKTWHIVGRSGAIETAP